VAPGETQQLIVVMGVSGVGKSTIARRLARFIAGAFIEADDFHPMANIEKMSRGEPLNDNDRGPWLDALSHQIKIEQATKAVLACSALNAYVQRRLLESDRVTTWLWLDADPTIISQRMKNRNHFMPPELLDSQLAALEVPHGAHRVDATLEVKDLMRQIISLLSASE